MDTDMNTPNDDFELRRRLRLLPRERRPARDLWDGIETRLQHEAPPQSLPASGLSWWRPAMAAAAALALAAIVVWRPAGPPAGRDSELVQAAAYSPAPTSQGVVRREAEGLALEYRLAIGSFAELPLPPAVQAATVELDASAASLHAALREQPDAPYLLDRLRRTYEQRLKLTRLAALG